MAQTTPEKLRSQSITMLNIFPITQGTTQIIELKCGIIYNQLDMKNYPEI